MKQLAKYWQTVFSLVILCCHMLWNQQWSNFFMEAKSQCLNKSIYSSISNLTFLPKLLKMGSLNKCPHIYISLLLSSQCIDHTTAMGQHCKRFYIKYVTLVMDYKLLSWFCWLNILTSHFHLTHNLNSSKHYKTGHSICGEDIQLNVSVTTWP